MKNNLVLFVLIIISIFFSGCARHNIPEIQRVIEIPNGNFTLYVSNQSKSIRGVDISISIDGKPLIEDYFEVKNQHYWKEYKLKLSPGEHCVYVETQKGSASLKECFEVGEKNWAVLSFVYNKKISPSFIFEVHDRPIGFL